MENSTNVFKGSFIPYVNHWGKRLNFFGILLAFGPCIGLMLLGVFPLWDGVISGLIATVPMVVSAYFYEPISYFAILGVPGTYMSFLSGNINNMRVPCSSMAQDAAGVVEGSEEGSIISTIGIAVSIMVNIVVLTLGVVTGSYILSQLPPSVSVSLNLLVPALFGAMFANQIVKKPALAWIAVPLSLGLVLLDKFGMLAFLPSKLITPFIMLICVFGTIGIGLVLAEKGKIK